MVQAARPGRRIGLFGFGGEIKREERITRKQVPEGGSLAGLPGTGQDDHRPCLRRAFQRASTSRGIHIGKIYDAIAYFARRADARAPGCIRVVVHLEM